MLIMKKMVMVLSLCFACMMSLGGTCLANWSHAYSSLHYFENRTWTRNFVLYEENPKTVGYNAVVELPDVWYTIRGEKNKLDDAFTYDPAKKIFTYYAPNENGAMRIEGEIIFTDDQHLIFTPAFSCSMFNAGEKVLMRETDSCDHWFIGDPRPGVSLWFHTYLMDAMRYVLHNR